jgi:hypothetical protein
MRKLLLVAAVAFACMPSAARAEPLTGVTQRFTDRVFDLVGVRPLPCPADILRGLEAQYQCGLFDTYLTSTFRSRFDTASGRASGELAMTASLVQDWRYEGLSSLKLLNIFGYFYTIAYAPESGVVLVRFDNQTISSALSGGRSNSSQPTGGFATPVLPRASNIVAGLEFQMDDFRIIAGNAFVATLSNRQSELTRLIGVGIPGSWAEEEALATFMLGLLRGKRVILRTDAEPRRDGYMMSYAFVDGVLVNAELIRSGLTRFVPDPQNKAHDDELKSAEDEAKTAGRGIWKK